MIYLTNVVVYVLIIVLSAYTRPDNRFQNVLVIDLTNVRSDLIHDLFM